MVIDHTIDTAVSGSALNLPTNKEIPAPPSVSPEQKSSDNTDATTKSSPTQGVQITSTAKPQNADKGFQYDRELAIIFGSACGLMLIVIIAMCIQQRRQKKSQERFVVGGNGIEITSSQF